MQMRENGRLLRLKVFQFVMRELIYLIYKKEKGGKVFQPADLVCLVYKKGALNKIQAGRQS